MLAARFGMFSHLWIDMAQRLGLQVDVLDAEWGEGAPVERYQEALAADKGHAIKAVLFTHNETATGVTSDVAGMRKALNDARHPALLMVDGVSSIGSIDFRMDEWGVDCAVTGSQKGLMLPAGLGIVAVSQKAARAVRSGQAAAGLLRFRRHEEGERHRLLPVYAVAAAAVRPARVARDALGGGLDNVFARHHRLAEGTRAAVKAWGLELCARAARSGTRTRSARSWCRPASTAPRSSTSPTGATTWRWAPVSRGWPGKLFRIGHLGDLNECMLLGGIAGAEMAMRDVGIKITPGSGVGAAEEYWRSTATPLDEAGAAAARARRPAGGAAPRRRLPPAPAR